MNWLQKIAQSKPMALPSYPGIKNKNVGKGVQFIDQQMNQNTVALLKKRFPKIRYFNHGNRGLVFRVGVNELLKATDNNMEFIRAQEAFNKKISWIVPILSEPIQVQRNPNLWIIHMKELKPLPANARNIINDLVYWVGSPDDLEQLGEGDILKNYVGYASVDVLVNLYRQLKSIKNENAALGINIKDLHGDNFGMDTDGKIKVLDLG